MSQGIVPFEKAARKSCLIPIAKILPNPDQPRKNFDEIRLLELASSIRQYGLLQPVTVWERADGFELVMGERRLRACKMLGLTHIDAFVLSTGQFDGATLALVENIQREDLHFLEEAEAYAAILRTGVTQEMLSRRLGKSISFIANKVRLNNLEMPVRQVILEENLTERHARALLRVPGGDARLRIARDAGERRLTVRETEECIKKELHKAPKAILPRRVISLARDPRLYVNAIRAVVRQMNEQGMMADIRVEEAPFSVTVTVTLPGKERGA